MSELEQELLKIINDLRAENAALLEVVLAQAGISPLDKEIIVPESSEPLGKVPWYIRKQNLERRYRKVERSENLSEGEGNAGEV